MGSTSGDTHRVVVETLTESERDAIARYRRRQDRLAQPIGGKERAVVAIGLAVYGVFLGGFLHEAITWIPIWAGAVIGGVLAAGIGALAAPGLRLIVLRRMPFPGRRPVGEGSYYQERLREADSEIAKLREAGKLRATPAGVIEYGEKQLLSEMEVSRGRSRRLLVFGIVLSMIGLGAVAGAYIWLTVSGHTEDRLAVVIGGAYVQLLAAYMLRLYGKASADTLAYASRMIYLRQLMASIMLAEGPSAPGTVPTYDDEIRRGIANMLPDLATLAMPAPDHRLRLRLRGKHASTAASADVGDD